MKPFFCYIFLFLIGINSLFSQNFNKNDILISEKDELKITHIFESFSNQNNLPIGKLMVEIGKAFLKTPYVPQTLETGESEIMVINLRQFDCTTFAENCLAFASCIRQGKNSQRDFINQLKKIRYRDGELNNYCSRLHYFSDWIYNNEQKGLIKQPRDLLNTNFPVHVDFMSKYPANYPALDENPELIPLIAEQEKIVSKREYFYLPKSNITENEHLLKEGDIIGITTNINGLDIAHVGLVVIIKECVHLLHASSSSNKVVISDKTLYDFLQAKRSYTGIMVARPLQ